MASENWPGDSPSPRSTATDLDRGAARYLFAIASLSSGDERVTTGELRKRLDVAPASATEMLSKLDDRALIDYEKYRGATLTERGETEAARVARRFCVVSTFFASELDTDLDDETAFAVGFVLPEAGVARLRRLVDSGCLGRCPESAGDGERCAA